MNDYPAKSNVRRVNLVDEVQATKQGPLNEQVNDLANRVDAVADRVATLTRRLEQVLTPPHPEPCSPEGSKAIVDDALSPVANLIREQRRELDMVIYRLDNILGRLEV